MSEDRHFNGGDNYESKSLEELQALLGAAPTALAAQLASEIGERGAAAKRLADGMNELASKLAGRWQSGSVDKAKAAGDLLRSYGDEQEQIAQGIAQPFASMAHVVKQVSEQVKELKLSGPELPKNMPSGLRPEEITVLRENIARREQAKEALRQEAIELGRSLDYEAERTDRVTPRFDDVPPVFAANPPPPAPRPPEGGGGGGGWTPPRPLPGEQGGGSPTPEQVARPGPGPTPVPEGWRPGEVERTGWDGPGGGQSDGGRSGVGGLDSSRGGGAGGGGGTGSFGGFGGGSFGGGGPGTEARRTPGSAPASPAGRGGGPTGVSGPAGRAGQGGGFMQPAIPGTSQGAEDEEHDRRYPYVDDLVGELPKVAPPVIGE